MRPSASLRGTLVQFDRPTWQPLISALGADLGEWFMWMHEIRLADGTAVHAYKHVLTRRYLHLTADGAAFAYLGDGRYAPVPFTLAVMRLVPVRDQALVDAEQLAALRAAARSRAAASEVRDREPG